MAQQTTVSLVDDLDGSKAVETVSFSLDGAQFEIDLNKKNAAALRKALAEFTDAARRIREHSAPRRKSTNSGASKVDPKIIRRWAESNGVELSSKGRIPLAIQEQYASASH